MNDSYMVADRPRQIGGMDGREYGENKSK